MAGFTLEFTDEKTVRRADAKRIQQGEIYVGPERQGTILKSCLCAGFWHPKQQIGAICHITGFRDDGAHTPHGALEAMRKGLSQFGLDISDCKCFLLGGAERASHVYDATVNALKKHNIQWQELDVMGGYHRKFVFDPSNGHILLYRKSDKEIAESAKKTYSSDRSYECFYDPKRRLITGASLFFRNQTLIHHLRNTILPELIEKERSERLHIWCAGCSLGMEAYSIAMIGLDWLNKRNCENVDFRILGSDISGEALLTARKGQYTVTENNELRQSGVFKKYTRSAGVNTIVMADQVRAVCAFRQRDIQAGSRHKFEVVVCDHVLQYFAPDIQAEMIEGLVTGFQSRTFAYIASPTPSVADLLQNRYKLKQLGRNFYRAM